jgi:1-acyl-sn-glycerol-3-phosphate acyltransferase
VNDLGRIATPEFIRGDDVSVLYRGLRQILRIGVDLYFVDIQSVGRHNVPADGPVIFAANHPNSIMDTVLLGTQANRKISYLAKSGLFTNPVVAWLFNECGVIPVHRSGGKGANEDAFRRAYEVLEESGTIGIFPEGRNSMEREMYEIKTGTARIALGAEARNDFDLGVRICPVGLNFQNRDRFLSSVLVRFGEPIDVREWKDAYAEDDRACVRELTENIQESLRELATHIEGNRLQDLVTDIHTIYGRRLLESVIADREEEKRNTAVLFDDLREGSWDDTPIMDDLLEEEKRRGIPGRVLDVVKGAGDVEDLDDDFFLKKRIAQAIQYYEVHDPSLVRDMKIRLWRYKDHLRQVQLKSDFFDRPPDTLSFRKEAVRFTAYMIGFALPAAWGFIHNLVPFVITRFFSLRAPDEAQRAITAFLVGMFVYPLSYAPWLFGIWHATGSWVWTLVYFLTLPLAGFFFLRYRAQLGRYRGRILTRTLFQTEKSLIESLTKERERLLQDFDLLRERFLEAEDELEELGEMPAPSFHGVDAADERPSP